MEKKAWSVNVVSIDGPDDLRKPLRGSDVEIVQLKPGKLQGTIKHFAIGNLGISLGQFSSEIRVRGALDQERVVLGTLLDRAGRVTQWWKETRPGDVGISPGLVEYDAIYGGGATYLAISIGVPELISMLRGKEHMADPVFWYTKRVCKVDPRLGAEIVQRLIKTMSSIEHRFAARPSDQTIDFLQLSILEPFVVGLTSVLPQSSVRCFTGARLVSETEDYIDAAGERPVHISELCSALRVTRRSLHRAFADTLDVGPAAYLRRRRLSAIQSILRRSDPATTSIGELAFEYGFPDAGRFSAYYRAHFGEAPSETLHSRSVSTYSPN